MKKITLILFLLFFCFNSYAQFPEGFEGESFPPTGWLSFDNGIGTAQSWTSSTVSNTGSTAAYVRYENVSGGLAQDWLVTPQFTPGPLAGSTLRFFQRQSYTTNYGTSYYVYVSTGSQETTDDFVLIDSQIETDFSFSYSMKEVDLSAYNGTPIYVAFVMENDDGDNWYIDDVDLVVPPSAVPSCATNFTNTVDATCGNEDFSVSWDAVDDATGYLFTAGTTSGGNDLADAVDLGLSTSYSFTGVADQTYYYTVTPYNAAGNAEACEEESVTTASLICSPCDAAVALTPGIQQTGDTADFEDSIDDSTCLGSYDGGNDAIFSYVATVDNETLTVTATLSSWSGVSMSLGCPTGDSSTYTCVGYSRGSASGEKTFTSDPLVAGETYYIHISTYPPPQTTTFTLDTVVNAAPADPPSCATNFTNTADESCGNYDFSVSWDAVSDADGYLFTAGTTSGGNDLADAVDLSGTSYSFTAVAGQSYYYTVTPYNTAGNAEGCEEQTVTTASGLCYCISQPSSNDGTGISSLSLNGTEFTSAGDVTTEDFSASVIDAAAGELTSLSITFATGYTYDTNVWIDLDNDFIYEDSELLFDGVSTSDNPTTLDASFTIPEATPDGVYNMRIGTADSGQSTPNPCYNGSYGVTVSMTVNVTTLGISDYSQMNFTYYPNPVNDQLTINAQTNVDDITVLNMLGQVVLHQSPNRSNCVVDMAALRTGVYFVQVSIGNKTETVRVLKQ